MRPAPARVGDAIADVDTPALIIDLDAFERNLDRMAEALRGTEVNLRAHAKTHKSPDIARLQVERGAIGVCCQTLGEAEVMAEGGILDILLTNQVVQPGKIRRLIDLRRRSDVKVCVDDPGNVADLGRAATEAGIVLPVLIEIDIGQGRCGVDPCEPALDLALTIAETDGLSFAGLHAYHGKAQHLRTVADRSAVMARAIGLTRETVALLAKNGFDCPIVSGAGTGTFPNEAASGVYNEVQAGSYIFMDADYLRVEGIAPRFEPALFVLATVVSRRPGRAVCDAGLKACSPDSGPPEVVGRPDYRHAGGGDEHGAFDIPPNEAPDLGSKLLLLPGHCDPTVNLHDWYVGLRDGKVETVWEIKGRGR